MKNREKRLRSIGSVALPPKWSPDYQRVIDSLKAHETPQMREYTKKAYGIAQANVAATLWNGSGLPMSKALRYYSQEYNHRVFAHGLHSMPTSFSFAESFFEYKPALNYFKIRVERDYFFSFTHFLDWITSASEENPLEQITNCMEEDIIYSFNVSEDPKAMEFSMEGGGSLCVAGTSLIRSGSEIVVLLTGGESGKEEYIEQYADNGWRYPGKENIHPDAGLKRERVMLEGVPDHQRVLAMTRFDLSDKTSLFRYYAEDLGNSFLTYVDDPETLKLPDGALIGKGEAMYEKMKQELDKRQAAFELCKTFMTLPVFAAANTEATKLQRFDTELKSQLKSLKNKKIMGHAQEYAKVFFREVREITPPSESSSYSAVTISTPAYVNNTDGHWKSLLPWEIGVGKDRHTPTKGRTWIRTSCMTSSEPAVPQESHIHGSFTNRTSIPKGPNHGFIYVMRNPQYERNIFKIGLTQRTSDIRANDLSRTSGMIDYFAVMQDWEVADCVLAEKEIHSKLASVRVTDRREFFKAPYKEIFSVIHEVVEKINDNARTLETR